MRNLIKIIIVLLAVSPLWLTIVAFGSGVPSEAWRDAINGKLLQLKDQRVQVVQFMSSMEVPDKEDLKKDFQLDLSGLKARGMSRIGLKFEDKKGRLEKLIWLRGKVNIQKQVPVSTHNLARGHLITQADIELQWRDASTLRGRTPTKLLGRQVKSRINAGQPFQERQLKKAMMVRKGERVRVTVFSEGMQLTMVAVAEENGMQGQTIRLMNPDSHKKIYATVVADQKAEVQL